MLLIPVIADSSCELSELSRSLPLINLEFAQLVYMNHFSVVRINVEILLSKWEDKAEK